MRVLLAILVIIVRFKFINTLCLIEIFYGIGPKLFFQEQTQWSVRLEGIDSQQSDLGFKIAEYLRYALQ